LRYSSAKPKPRLGLRLGLELGETQSLGLKCGRGLGLQMEWGHKGAAQGMDGLKKEIILGNSTEGLVVSLSH